jgi:hypothetical protein
MRIAFAYLDAGSVSMALTAVAGGVAGVSVYLKSHVRGLKQRVLRRPADVTETPTDVPVNDQG